STNCAIIRSRYVFSTARGSFTWRTPAACQSSSWHRTSMPSHIRNTNRGRGSVRLPTSSALFRLTWKPSASRCLAVRRRISASSVSRPGEFVRSRKMPQQDSSITRWSSGTPVEGPQPLPNLPHGRTPKVRDLVGCSCSSRSHRQRLGEGHILDPVHVHDRLDHFTVHRLTTPVQPGQILSETAQPRAW